MNPLVESLARSQQLVWKTHKGGAKGLYTDILPLLEERLGVGALIVGDNAEWGPEYLARVHSPSQTGIDRKT